MNLFSLFLIPLLISVYKKDFDDRSNQIVYSVPVDKEYLLPLQNLFLFLCRATTICLKLQTKISFHNTNSE